jgi:DNA-binding winged helix-turn-helix (wHTH) protein/Tol biopolymer transport system component
VPPALDPVYLFGPFRVSVASLELSRNGQAVALPPKTFDTLVLLIANRQRVVTKEELLKTVWKGAFVTDDSLSQCISGLRKVLGDDPNQPSFVATIPRRGYRFIAPVETEVVPVEPVPPAVPVPPEPAVAISPAPPAGGRMPWGTLAAAVVALAIGAGIGRWLAESPQPAFRLNLQPGLGSTLASGAVLSPDGRLAAYVAEEGRSGRSRLWVSTLNGGEPRALPGTDGAVQPFWSPDSQALGFFAGGALKTITIESGAARSVTTLGFIPAGATWSEDGTILFASFRSNLSAVSLAGGRVTTVTKVDSATGERAHEWPMFLPGGSRFLFSVDASDPQRAGTYLGSLAGGTPVRLVPDQQAIYAPPGYLIYVRDRSLMAHRFDPDRARVDGNPQTLVGNVSAPSLRNGASVSAAPGLLAYGGATGGGRLVWLDRNGQQLGVVNAPGELHNPAMLLDERRVLADGNGIWAADLDLGTATRLVVDGNTPIPSPDGARILFNAVRNSGVADLYIRALDGTTDELVLHTAENVLPNDWTRDGRFIVYVSRNPQRGRDIWLLPTTEPRTPIPFAQGDANEIQAQVSPDGSWIAYASDESGVWEVYLESFPKGGRKRAVSSGGGAKPQWRGDGRELYYLTMDRVLMAVPVDQNGGIGQPAALFQAPVVADLGTYRSQFAVTRDGRRFLVDAADPASIREPITVLVNWTRALGR